jgi:hypothetical protein
MCKNSFPCWGPTGPLGIFGFKLDSTLYQELSFYVNLSFSGAMVSRKEDF